MIRKSSILFSVILCFGLWVQAQGTTKNVLFIGNSYTDVNNLPSLVQQVSRSMGDDITYESNTPGGCTFEQHCDNQSMTLIQQGGWDVVVLQEQSQLPSFPDGQVAWQCLPYAAQLVEAIYETDDCAEPMFYMTWGRKNGDSQNAAAFPPLGTYEGMDSLLALRYTMMAEDNDASLCPVGRVWHYIRDSFPHIELYSADESHPSMAGSYAAACAFYTMIFHRDPVAITYNPGIDEAEAATIRQVASIVVFQQLEEWLRPMPQADFSYENGAFQNLSQDAVDYYWDFGNGETSMLENPTNTLPQDGDYQVKLIATRHCMSDTIQKIIHVGDGVGIEDINGQARLKFANPVRGTLNVDCEGVYELFDSRGRRVLTGEGGRPLDVRALPSGLYLLRIQGQSYKIVVA